MRRRFAQLKQRTIFANSPARREPTTGPNCSETTLRRITQQRISRLTIADHEAEGLANRTRETRASSGDMKFHSDFDFFFSISISPSVLPGQSWALVYNRAAIAAIFFIPGIAVTRDRERPTRLPQWHV